MTSLPVVDLTSCSRYLIFLNAQSMVGPENRMLLGSCHWNGLMEVPQGGPDIPNFAQLDAAIVGIAQHRKPSPPEARVDLHLFLRPSVYLSP